MQIKNISTHDQVTPTVPPEPAITTDDKKDAKPDAMQSRGVKRPRERYDPETATHYMTSKDIVPYASIDDENTARVRDWMKTCLGLTGGPDCPITPSFHTALHLATQAYQTGEWPGIREALSHVPDLASVDNIVSFGICTFYLARDVHDAMNFICELAVIMFIRDMIREARMKKRLALDIPIVFQDPLFCNADVRLLKSLGGQVVRNNYAIKSVSPSSVVIGVHLPCDFVWDMFLRKTDPAIYIGNNVDDCNSRALRAASIKDGQKAVAEIRASLRRVNEGHDSSPVLAMGQDRDKGFHSEQFIYWRKTEIQQAKAEDNGPAETEHLQEGVSSVRAFRRHD